ncbi:uncharacterized protein LOC117321548 [Pecten maximus]|uniref:uncharacterized protein LOC117321548 n=1 Tax=Pecten maximus TaxID=6579 RepID=UPI00145899C8|nr:uncharacterized protein LOC117321548 [Pecten maximus]
MRVHVFGNSPSPSVATYGLRKSACNREDIEHVCDNVCDYVNNNFYVDDALTSLPSSTEAVSLVKHAQQRLKDGGNICLHKIVSNDVDVLGNFPPSDLAKNFEEINFNTSEPTIQRSLGLCWNVLKDSFTYQVSQEEKPFTKRGLLSVVNSIFDPLGFVAPVVLGGRLLLREAIQENRIGWDESLPEKVRLNWDAWKQSIQGLESLEIPRIMSDTLSQKTRSELHIFSDASRDAIGAVAYLKQYDDCGNSQLGFVLGKSKVAPAHGHAIPRLELCASVMATELSNFIHKHLAMEIASTFFYTDSQVVLGYINNETRRFYVYVGNRVDKILKSSTKSQWWYVPTGQNPADHATRPVNAHKIKDCSWLQGP